MGLFLSGQWRMEASRGGGRGTERGIGRGMVGLTGRFAVADTRKNDKLLKTFKWGKYVAYIKGQTHALIGTGNTFHSLAHAIYAYVKFLKNNEHI